MTTMKGCAETIEMIRSIPALAAAIRETHSRAWPISTGDGLRAEALPAFYQIQAKSEEAEARAATHLVSEVAERMRRLGEAYGEWDVFDPSAYFDLTEAQARQLVHVVERVSTVYVAFFVDPLLPAFHQAEAFWATHFFPAYHAAIPADGISTWDEHLAGNDTGNGTGHGTGHGSSNSTGHGSTDIRQISSRNNLSNNGGKPRKTSSQNGSVRDIDKQESAFTADFATVIYPEMVAHWNHLVNVGHQARRLLADHIGYLAVNGSQEERGRWRAAWTNSPPAVGLHADICPDYRTLPTLSLSIEFPLPIYRQPGRQQRLRLNRQHRRSPRL